MAKEKLQIISSFMVYDHEKELTNEEQLLVSKAREASRRAYAPYSNFHVGAAVLLNNNEIISGNNQENSAYPSGLCAERVAIFYAGSIFPNIEIKCISIYCDTDRPISPCGACRQALIEYEQKQKTKIKVILCSKNNKVITSESITAFLPLQFDSSFLKK